MAKILEMIANHFYPWRGKSLASLRLCTFTAEGLYSIPGRGTTIRSHKPRAKKKKEDEKQENAIPFVPLDLL